MFTAPRHLRARNRNAAAGSTATLIAVLLLANLVAIAGLGASAHAQGFPDAMHYAPLSWEKKAPVPLSRPQTNAAPQAEVVPPVEPVERGAIAPLASEAQAAEAAARQAVAREAAARDVVSREQAAPTTASIAKAGHTHRMLLIALMSIALATMAGVSAFMFRSLAREIAATERKRGHF
ncbi:hypothetical protein [Oricola sp.]|uniref:hypothetical protein n=1 Tax=Oricola sp. TaxID=1979950 RepID=UPI0025E659F9|nr:hypothetical protein [Oricola sp.]MCI5074294.1 hypothetical protein [Oricola sp.]